MAPFVESSPQTPDPRISPDSESQSTQPSLVRKRGDDASPTETGRAHEAQYANKKIRLDEDRALLKDFASTVENMIASCKVPYQPEEEEKEVRLPGLFQRRAKL